MQPKHGPALAERGGRERGVLLALAVAGGAVGRGHAGRGRSGSRGRWTGRVGRAAVCVACARAGRLVSGPGLQGGRRGRVLRAGVRVGAGQARTRAACGVLGRSVGRAGEGEGVAGPAGLGRGAGMDRGWAQVAGWAAGPGQAGWAECWGGLGWVWVEFGSGWVWLWVCFSFSFSNLFYF